MKKAELLDIVTVIVMAYPDRFREEHIPGMVTAWYAFFKDDDAKAVKLAVMRHISGSKWPPSIAEIRAGIVDIFHPELIPPDMAWAAVADLLDANGGNGFGVPVFPPLIGRVVETVGWHTLKELRRGSCAGNKDGMDKVAFMELYKPAYERAREEAGRPAALAAAMVEARRVTPGADAFLREAENRRRETERFEQLWLGTYGEAALPGGRELQERTELPGGTGL